MRSAESCLHILLCQSSQRCPNEVQGFMFPEDEVDQRQENYPRFLQLSRYAALLLSQENLVGGLADGTTRKVKSSSTFSKDVHPGSNV